MSACPQHRVMGEIGCAECIRAESIEKGKRLEQRTMYLALIATHLGVIPADLNESHDAFVERVCAVAMEREKRIAELEKELTEAKAEIHSACCALQEEQNECDGLTEKLKEAEQREAEATHKFELYRSFFRLLDVREEPDAIKAAVERWQSLKAREGRLFSAIEKVRSRLDTWADDLAEAPQNDECGIVISLVVPEMRTSLNELDAALSDEPASEERSK